MKTNALPLCAALVLLFRVATATAADVAPSGVASTIPAGVLLGPGSAPLVNVTAGVGHVPPGSAWSLDLLLVPGLLPGFPAGISASPGLALSGERPFAAVPFGRVQAPFTR